MNKHGCRREKATSPGSSSPKRSITTGRIIAWHERRGKKELMGPGRQQQNRRKKSPASLSGKIILGKRNFSEVFAFSADTVAAIGGPFHPLEPAGEGGGREGIQTARGVAVVPCSCLNSMSQLSDLQYEPPQCMIFAIVCVVACTRMHSCSPKCGVCRHSRRARHEPIPSSLSLSLFLFPLSLQKRANPARWFVYVHAKLVKLGENFIRYWSISVISVQRWISQARV